MKELFKLLRECATNVNSIICIQAKRSRTPRVRAELEDRKLVLDAQLSCLSRKIKEIKGE